MEVIAKLQYDQLMIKKLLHAKQVDASQLKQTIYFYFDHLREPEDKTTTPASKRIIKKAEKLNKLLYKKTQHTRYKFVGEFYKANNISKQYLSSFFNH